MGAASSAGAAYSMEHPSLGQLPSSTSTVPHVAEGSGVLLNGFRTRRLRLTAGAVASRRALRDSICACWRSCASSVEDPEDMAPRVGASCSASGVEASMEHPSLGQSVSLSPAMRSASRAGGAGLPVRDLMMRRFLPLATGTVL
jgi:hypothetical protein